MAAAVQSEQLVSCSVLKLVWDWEVGAVSPDLCEELSQLGT